jgi:cysteine-rich repeat protein
MRSSWSARTALTTLLVTGASSVCARAHAACGDGVIDAQESCDDRNTQGRDGCNESCQVEAGYVCTGTTSTCCFRDAAAAYALLADASLDAQQGIVTLTPEDIWKEGTAWYRQPLDFTQPFTISVQLYLGTRDGQPTLNASAQDLGADGGALLFQRDPRGLATKGQYAGSAGEDGGELGAKGISPVVGVEFDTYNNGPTFGDVTVGDEDHTSVFTSGAQPASNQLTSSVCMNAGSSCANFEDGAWHRFDVSWSGNLDHHLQVFVDGTLRIDLANDLVLDHFADDPSNILFGFAASTGGYFNLQRFCPLAPYGFGVPRDLDRDGIDDVVDADTDGDGISDALETGDVFGARDPDADHDHDGVPDYLDVEYWSEVLMRACADVVAPVGACDSFPAELDFDRDGIADHVDLDADADGTPDASDDAPRDPCMPGPSPACAQSLPDAGGVEVVDASVVDASVAAPDASMPPAVEGPTPGDLDGDQVPNEVDVAPNDPCQPNKHALACASGDPDSDKLNNAFECPGLRMCRDTDGDGVSDYADPDSDGDGIPDSIECPDASKCPDADGDGTPDLLSPALPKADDGCALAQPARPLSLLWLLLLVLSARTGSSVRCAIARACAARRSLPWSRAARRRPPATPRSS